MNFEISRNAKYCNTAVVSQYTSIPEATLETWRSRKSGPKFCKVGRNVLYDINDVDEYMNERKVNSTSEYQARKNNDNGIWGK